MVAPQKNVVNLPIVERVDPLGRWLSIFSPLWQFFRCVPGKQESAFVGLANLQNLPHKWHGFRILAHNLGVAGSSPAPQLFGNQNSQCHVSLFNLLTFFFFFVQLVCRINQLSAVIVVFLQVASF